MKFYLVQGVKRFCLPLNLISPFNILDTKRKALVTGTIPTEQLPRKPNEKRESERRALVRHSPTNVHASSSASTSTKSRFEKFSDEVKEADLHPWILKESSDGEIRIELSDENSTIPKYTLLVDICNQVKDQT